MDLVICPTKLSIIVIWFGKTYIHVTWFWFHGICTGICTFRQHRQIYFNSALSTLGEIYTNSMLYFEELMHILTKRFAPENQTELYRSQIDARIRKKGDMQEINFNAFISSVH
jgi:hypothetical protein